MSLVVIGCIPTAAVAWTPTTPQVSVAVFGGPDNDTSMSVAVDGSGNIYTTGYFTGTVDFDPGPGNTSLASAGGIDMFISKLDASGNLLWAKTYGNVGADVARSIVVDGSGNTYTTGYLEGTVDFDPGPGNTMTTGGGFHDAFVLKLDASGNLVWARAFGGTQADSGWSVAVDGSGNTYTTGSFNGTADFDPSSNTTNLISAGGNDVFVSKLDASGNLVWARGFGGTVEDISQSVAVDSSGNVYTTGYFNGTADFDPGSGITNLTPAGGNDMFISKLNASGNLAWAKAIGDVDPDIGRSVAVDGSGNIYITGNFNGAVDFDPGSGSTILTSAGNNDVFMLKLNTSGNLVWARAFGGASSDIGRSVAVDGSGNTYVTGHFQGTADFDPGAGFDNQTSEGNNDVFLSKLDASGNLLWAKTFGGPNSHIAVSVAVDGSGNTYITGYFVGATDFDPGPGTANLTSSSTNDMFVLKLDALGSASYTTTTTTTTITTTTTTTTTTTPTTTTTSTPSTTSPTSTTVAASTTSTTSTTAASAPTTTTNVTTSPTSTSATSATTPPANVTASTTASAPTATTISTATTVNAEASQGQNSVTTNTSTSEPSGSVTTSDTIAPTTTAQTTSTSVPQSTLPEIKVPYTEVGGASALIGGVEVDARVTRVNNELQVSVGTIFARIWATTKSGGKVPLDADGRLRLQVGDSVTVNVEGLDAATPVEVRLYSDPVLLGRTKVDASGRLGVAYEIPESVPHGNHSVVMMGTSNGDEVTLGLSVAIGDGSARFRLWVIALPVGLAMLTAVLLPVALRRRMKNSLT